MKYRPHLYGIYLALGSLSRLKELNHCRQRNYDILCSELAGCEAVQPVKTTPEATRGGFLEFIVRYTPEKAGNWNTSAFIQAAKAEGVPISNERYARIGKRKRMLNETPIFSTFDGSDLGGLLPTGPDWEPNPGDLPVVSTLSERLMTLPAFTKVSEQYVRDCAAALKKVAACAASMEAEASAAAA